MAISHPGFGPGGDLPSQGTMAVTWLLSLRLEPVPTGTGVPAPA